MISIILSTLHAVSFVSITGISFTISFSSLKLISFIVNSVLPLFTTNLYDPSGMLITVNLSTNVVDNTSLFVLSYTFILASSDGSVPKKNLKFLPSTSLDTVNT